MLDPKAVTIVDIHTGKVTHGKEIEPSNDAPIVVKIQLPLAGEVLIYNADQTIRFTTPLTDVIKTFMDGSYKKYAVISIGADGVLTFVKELPPQSF